MQNSELTRSTTKLDLSKAHLNLKTAQLYEFALSKGEAKLSDKGALVTSTGEHTGRAASDKFIVEDATTKNTVGWGDINRPISEAAFWRLREQVIKHLSIKSLPEKLPDARHASSENAELTYSSMSSSRDEHNNADGTSRVGSQELFVQDCIAGADPKNCVYVRVVTETAFHSLFIRNMLSVVNTNSARLSYGDEIIENFNPEYTVYHAPSLKANPAEEKELHSDTFIIVNYTSKEVIIGGTAYAGEIKKSVFSILNFIYPQRGIMPMHSSANTNAQGEVSIFFGLSGTGKTTLSADPERLLIGDDEHGWSDEGVFNFEDGCYAKSIGLTAKTEPEIYNASRRFGTTVENVAMNENRELDYFDKSITENGRISYPLYFIPNSKFDRFVRKNPKNIIMLTCDAFGVLPAVCKLTPEEASEQFQLGYTARIPGTEMGVMEPKAVFSPCFGAPFMPLPPKIYGDLLKEKISHAKVNCWLVNTGWAGGSYGQGKRMSLELTRSIIHGINSGLLAKEECVRHSILGVQVPISIELPELSWKDQADYEKTAKKLLDLFAAQKAKLV